jgi:5-methylcytosine-specific restriction enzyme A
VVPRGRGRCDTHQRQRERAVRAQRAADPHERALQGFYNSVAWKRLRAAYRSAHPTCEECERVGVVRAGVDVDHRVPIREGGARLDQRNLQTLCVSHHAAKSATESNERRRPAGNR